MRHLKVPTILQAGFMMDRKNYVNHPEYDFLPESIKVIYSQKEFAWLGENGRERILDDICYPDSEGDDY